MPIRWMTGLLFLYLAVSTGSAQPAVYPNPVVRAYLVAMSYSGGRTEFSLQLSLQLQYLSPS